ncbi:MAG: EAL domain-containing protein [Actinomycetota bacterium]
MTFHKRGGQSARPVEDPRLIARLRKTQRIRINSATSVPVLACIVGWSMWRHDVSTARIATWFVPMALATLLAAWAAFSRRGRRMARHPFDRLMRLPVMLSVAALPILLGMPMNSTDYPEAAVVAMIGASSLIALTGLQYRRHRRIFVSMISGIGFWYAAMFIMAGQVGYGILCALWVINLCVVLIYALNTRNDLAEFSDENLRLSRLDGLTGALNREGLQARWRSTRDSADHHTLLLVDLDRFKDVNDRWGHKVGDELLIESTRRLFDTVGVHGWVARLGGDEFAALMPGRADDLQVRVAIDGLVSAFDQPFLAEGKTMRIDASVGIVNLQSEDDLAVALTNADFAMFDAKRSADQTVSLFDPTMRAALDRRRYLEKAIPVALVEGEFEWWGQPILDTTTLEPKGVELLCRWKHDGSYQNPAEFLPIMADADLLSELGRKNLEFAARWLARWREDQELSEIGLNVNLAPHHLLTSAVDDIAEAIPFRDRARLGIELVETEVIPQGAGLRGQAERLGEMGCRLVLDDFGAGYSALSVLSDLNVSTIKIDRSLVAGLDGDERKSKLVAAASQIGITLGTSTVCEGVETEEELGAIREIGIPLVQGWLFSKALPMDECEALLRRLADVARQRADARFMDELDTASPITPSTHTPQ